MERVPGCDKRTIFPALSGVLCFSHASRKNYLMLPGSLPLNLDSFQSVFDNIPLTKLCLDQGHFDWGMLAYSVGFGGSMIWFGIISRSSNHKQISLKDGM